MNGRTCSKYIGLVLLLWAAWAPAAPGAEKRNTYRNQEFHFSFQYPAAWVINSTASGNLRVKVAAPADAPPAECAMVIKRYPKAVSAKQSDIDQIFMTPPSPSELEEVLNQGNGGIKVSKATTETLDARPAHGARVHYKTGQNAYASGRVIMTATPGLTWTLSCSGLGATPAEAEQNFRFWEGKIHSLVSSFTFKELPKSSTTP